jgi:hypothetical protein
MFSNADANRMKRLPFRLHEFTRVIWTSEDARSIWAPRIRGISKAWQELEVLSVSGDLRECAICYVPPDAFVDRVRNWSSEDLFGAPLQIHAQGSGYSTVAREPNSRDPIAFRVAVGRPKSVQAFLKAYDNQDDVLVGQLLGFPRCCTAFFRENWIDKQLYDTTWPMAIRSMRGGGGSGRAEIDVVPIREANIMWRWLGIRAVPHLPCSFHCEGTAALGRSFLELGRSKNFTKEIGWLEEILSWPLEWSCLHGIAEVRTPILKFTTNTDATPDQYIVRLSGSSFPASGVKGLRFPYRAPKQNSRVVKQSLPAVGTYRRRGTSSWCDESSENGFSSNEAMDSAHRPLLALLTRHFQDASAQGYALDLGCGNGALLAKIHTLFPRIIPIGVDIDESRARIAGDRLKCLKGEVVVGNIFDSQDIWPPDRQYSLSIVCVTRFFEVEPSRSAHLKEKILRNSANVLMYVYDDGMYRYKKSLANLIADAGFTQSGWDFQGHAAITVVPRNNDQLTWREQS